MDTSSCDLHPRRDHSLRQDYPHYIFGSSRDTYISKIFDMWRIRLPDDFFTFRFKSSDGQTHDIPLNSNLYWTLDFHRPGWNRSQHAEDNSTIPFEAGLTQPYILHLTAHRSS